MPLPPPSVFATVIRSSCYELDTEPEADWITRVLGVGVRSRYAWTAWRGSGPWPDLPVIPACGKFEILHPGTRSRSAAFVAA
ncbi:hypothetical protein WCLP8_5360005 [uncultured Gammaproteobacteria bacterium]